VGIKIVGHSYRLGSYRESNEELCLNLDVDADWIVQKTGIKQRFLVDSDEGASDLAYEVAYKALNKCGITPSEVDLIICCTFSNDYSYPALAAKVHKSIGAKRECQTFDLQANCAGFVAGLSAASDLMSVNDFMNRAVVIGVEINSAFIDRTDKESCIYMSDGAAAIVLEKSEEYVDSGKIASAFDTDSSTYEAVRLRYGGSRYSDPHGVKNGTIKPFMEMNGIATWKQAITLLPKNIKKCVNNANISLSDVDHVFFHQANKNMIEYIMKKLKLDDTKTYINVDEIGNTGAASVGIALSDFLTQNEIKPGATVLFSAVGAGFNFGSIVWRW
jgi:3-oxoacyl-[acyl-carrier-protein] synthase III